MAFLVRIPRLWLDGSANPCENKVMKSQEPRLNEAATLNRDQQVLLPVYPRYEVVFTGGSGVYLTDANGRKYLDTVSGLGVNALGYAHPRMVETMRDQAGSLIHLSNHYSSGYPGELAEKLCAMTGLAAAFYSTGGTEAMEGALKLARLAALQNYGPGKHVFVSLKDSYHGRTFGALSVTGQEKYRDGFEPALPPARFVARNNIAELRAAMDKDVCAVLIEPVMGEGGVHECSTEFMKEARRLADLHGALLILDEIQCGLGRTGAWFVYQEHGIQPDILVVGKPLGGGLPLSAILVQEHLRNVFAVGKHGSTLGGGVLATRLGLEFLSIMEDEGLLDRIKQTGAYLRKGLLQLAAEHDSVDQARGRGLLQGLALKQPARPLAEAALREGLLLNVIQGNILRFLPPFLLEKKHVDFVLEQLDSQLRKDAAPAVELVDATVSVAGK
jgi:acetylornithine/succinyldiaminopimelate/putrescine aminotransferase